MWEKLKEGPARKHEITGERKEGIARFARGSRGRGGERGERGERARTSVHVVARGEAWFVGGPCTPDRCNPLGTHCSAKPYSFLSAVRHPTLFLALPLFHRAFTPAYGAAARVSRRVLPRACASCTLGTGAPIRYAFSAGRDRQSRCSMGKLLRSLSKKFGAKDPWGSDVSLYFGDNLRDWMSL